HEGRAADALRAAVRECPSDFLLERLEEAGSEREHDDPEAEHGLVVDGGVNGRQLAIRQREKRVRGETTDGDTRAHGVGPLGARQLARLPENALPPFSQEGEMVPPPTEALGEGELVSMR